MAYTIYTGGTIRGTFAERATVPATVPINTIYIATDTQRVYIYAGASVWNEISYLTSAGADEEAKVLQNEAAIGAGIARKLNFSITSDFAITENTGIDAYDIKIADNAISNNHVSGSAAIVYSKLNASTFPKTFSNFVNVKDHGALGDGTTDDSTAFTNALAAVPAAGGTIFVPDGTFRVDNFTINRNNIRLLGASWGSIIQSLTSGEDCIRIDLAGVETTREDIIIENLYIKGRGTGTSGHGITNRHTGSLFAAASDTNLDYTIIQHCKFTDYASGKNCIDLRNVDNRLTIRHNRFTTVNGKDIVIEANGRAGGNILITENGMTHGAPQGCIELRSNATNIKRTNIINNTIVISQAANAIPAILLQNDGGTIEHVNIIGNTIEDAKYGVDVGGSGTGLIKDVKINNNWFFHRTDPAESGARCVMLRAVARGCYVTNNYYEGDPDTSITPIENLNTTAPLNFVYEKAQNFVNSTTYITENQGSSIQSGTGSATTFNIAHGLNITPSYVVVKGGSVDTNGSYWLTKDATNITVNYAIAPPSGSSNLTWYWRAA